ncbi:MAG TPA: EFR1 family ferrodoxin [Williamwhitmania sp.]|nr:EFR1 family ferrodoxin [Williamwhitmania sp.]
METMEALNLIYYSPTGTTQTIVREIGHGLGLSPIAEYNISSTKTDSGFELSNRGLTVIGMPTYSGRLPIDAIERLKKFHANNAPAVIVAVYGNRAFEDALLELKEIASNSGFNVIAAAAFIGEHSYSTVDKPLAQGRPDKLDLIQCADFARRVHSKMMGLKGKNEVSELEVPGNYPYKERKQLDEAISPETDFAKCTKCGICVDACPTNAITINDEVITNKELCTWCCACIKSCPVDARFFNNPIINATKERLYSICTERKEPEFFL